MIFKVEDGTGLTDSTSYVDIGFADDYFSRTGYSAWEVKTDEQKQIVLETGTEYADLRWGSLLKGSVSVSTQALEFPRAKLFDRYQRAVTGVPVAWKRAICEYGMQSTKGSLVTESITTEADLKKKKTVVGPITTEKEFFTGVSSSTFKNYPKADLLVKSYLGSVISSSSGKVARN